MWLRAKYLLFCSSLLLAPALADEILASTLKGKITDGAGKPLPGVTLLLRNLPLSLPERHALTDTSGTYRFTGLPAGDGYSLNVSLPGYASLEFTNLVMSMEEGLIQDAVLRPASEMRETVRVEGKPGVVDTESVTTSTSFSAEFIAGLPLLGRDYQDILSLAPGVTDVNKTGNPNIHGARDTGVVTLVDSVSVTDPFTGYYGQQLNLESIQEIEVITSGARAEFSRAQGGFANILTKSGGNEFQGTFKFFLRSSRLDGDGAGVDPVDLHGGVSESEDFRNVRFSDLYPFLSFSGPLVHDRLWYYVTAEYVLVENPQNVVTQFFVTRTCGYRAMAKTTWQIHSSNRLAFSILVDRTVDENLGVDSLTSVEGGYYFKRGGPTYTLRDSATLSASLFLESTVSWFDNNFAQLPTLYPDTNHNGFQFTDDRPWMGGNGDHILQAKERDPGLDFDHDGAWDQYEDLDPDPDREAWTDLDGDGRNYVGYHHHGCEGEEDLNCDGEISSELDLNLNGIADPEEDVGLECTNPLRCHGSVVPGTAGNGRLDTEDKNGNLLLDTYRDSGPTSFPSWQDRDGDGLPDPGEFVAPLSGDREREQDLNTGLSTGPYPYQYDDHRKRFTWREDFSSYVGNLGGTHDLKVGFAWEHEGFSRDTVLRPEVTPPIKVFTGYNRQYYHRIAFLGAPSEVNNAAVAENLGFFAQDTYKPLPNLTLGLGVRVDLERVASRGFTTFDPAAERATYDSLMGLSGVDTVFYDSIHPTGLQKDPLYATGGGPNLSQLSLALRGNAPHFLTRHNLLVDVTAPLLGNYLPDQGDDFASFAALAGKTRSPEEFELLNTNVAPRLSVSWDPFGDGKSKAFGSWGRFYDKLFLQSVLLELGPDSVVRDYFFDEDGWDSLTGYPNNGFEEIYTGTTLSVFQVDRNLSTPFTDELTLGFQREIASEVSLSLTYVHRNYRNQLQDIDLNHTTRVNPATGRLLDTFGGPLCRRTKLALGGVCRDSTADPSLQNEAIISPPDGLPDLYIQNFLFNRVMRLGNFNAQTYRGLELELVKRLARKWQMEASYTFSKSWGDAESYRDSYGDDPSVTEFQEGYLDYDQRHVVKMNAVAYLPRDWQIGGTAQWASGLPYSSIELGRASLDDVTYTQVRRRFGYVRGGNFIPENRNIHRNNAVYDFNARVQKSFVMGKASGSAFLEIFNLLNSDDLRIYEIHPGQVALQADEERRFGRRYQIGFQLNF